MSITPYTKAGKRAYRAKIKFQGAQYTQAGLPTLAAARAWMVEKRKELKAAAASQPLSQVSDSMFSTASAAYLEDCQARMQPGTVREKFRHYADLATYVQADFILSALQQKICESHISSIQAESGNKTANRHLRSLKAFWTWAIKKGRAVGNPWSALDPYPEDTPTKYIPPSEDVASVLMACKPWERDFLNVLLRSAARAGELRKMVWDDVDLSRGVLMLWTRKRKGGARQPRPVTMSPQLKELMQRLWDARDKGSPYVFTNPATGGAYSRQAHSMKYMMERLCERAGVREFGLHSLRHYVAVRLRDSGKASKFDIQAILGHQRSDTTDIYLRGLAPDLKDAVSSLDEEPIEKTDTCTPGLYPLGRQ